jgi:hypothetical protein
MNDGPIRVFKYETDKGLHAVRLALFLDQSADRVPAIRPIGRHRPHSATEQPGYDARKVTRALSKTAALAAIWRLRRLRFWGLRSPLSIPMLRYGGPSLDPER